MLFNSSDHGLRHRIECNGKEASFCPDLVGVMLPTVFGGAIFERIYFEAFEPTSSLLD